MTPDPTPAETAQPNSIPSTQGMTKRVVKGSIWTLAGQVLPLLLSVITTHFVIRMLGSEGYGVLVLITLIPTYFSFADFGMSLASTKFASEAYASGDKEKEGRIVRTAALISFLTSLPIGILIFIFSNLIVSLFKIPVSLQAESSLALKIAAVTFVINFLNLIFNTPQLTRLRMDLNTLVTAGTRIAGIIAVPFIIYAGFGVAGAMTALLIAALLALIFHLLVSIRLLKELLSFSFDRSVIRPMLKFGGGLVISGIAVVLLINLEKVVLVSITSVQTLAHYSVAFTLASMVVMFSSSMLQSLIPAFSQLLQPEKREQLESLFARTLRLNVIGILPIIAFLFVIARPFFTIWAGPEFGSESTLPFYILLGGWFFNLLVVIPHSLLVSSGRTDLLAKIYWLQILPYLGLIVVLTLNFGAVGTASAWTLRVVADTVMIGWSSKKTSNVSFHVFRGKLSYFGSSILCLTPCVLMTALAPDLIIWSLAIFLVSLATYVFLVWKKLLDTDEKLWMTGKMTALFNR